MERILIKMLCAIHQPNFFPWMGYFNKIYQADRFVFMDDVAFEKSGHSMQSYANRVSIVNQGRTDWVRCPVVREHGIQIIRSVLINNNIDWKSEICTKICTCYQNADFYGEVYPFIIELLDWNTEYIAELNIHIISELAKKLNIRTDLIVMSNLETHYASTKLLVEIIESIQCDSYLCGSGAQKYQEEDLFQKSGINLIHQNYSEPYHVQFGNKSDFIAGQSILDVLFNCGFAGTEKLIKKTGE